MQDRHLFEYAVIRVMPRVEREEFINVGIIMYCNKLKYLKAAFQVSAERLKALNCELETEIIEENLNAIVNICKGGKLAGPIGQLDLASRFRWLTATRSTVVQCSKVHPGFCIDAEETLNKLMQELVL
ncbi:DUF3037 domain-containing protein [Pedobacter sp. SL55]|uniref:DUF3037 domain-containing protein n=1 Tax=Pedobacter sp. SL55 TaxID=2995161 RepID=UPI00226F91AC|nr:DUF3037 domain-containing protein [Pedobacter sp. SL55]WAC39889.1 DUF3037 domain-containing protein [Pedobacter sp. SL55]